MKKWMITLLALLIAAAPLWPAGAAGQFSAYIKGETVYGNYAPQENLAIAGFAVCGETSAKRYELFGALEMKKLAQGVVTQFSIDLGNVQALLRVTDLKGGTGEYFSTITDAQRADMLSGKLSVRVYRGTDYTDDEKLAQCDIDPNSAEMTLYSAGVVNGALSDEYGKKGTQKHKGIPTLSPPLTIGNLPEGTKALALTMIDPDGQNWVHWLVANIPVAEELPKNSSIAMADSLLQGKNDFGSTGYGGPTPPSGTHHYVITVYALSDPLPLKDGYKLKAFQKALEGKVLAQAVLTATYSK